MNKKSMLIVLLVVVIAAAVGWWIAPMHDGGHMSPAEHQHLLLPKTDAEGKTYYTCPMHPQVRQDKPGNCPICGMRLTQREDKPAAKTSADTKAHGDREILYWYDPMKPDQHFDAPGKSPFMDMDLVPKYADDNVSAEGAMIVEIDPRMAQNLGMRTAAVRIGSFWQRVDAVGSVAVDENRIVTVEARAAGWVERLDVRTAGETVKRGQVLAGVYAPDILAAQEELALAQKLGDAALIDAARSRLSLLGVSGSGQGGPQRRVSIVAPQAGVVTELLVSEGAQVTPGMPLMKLADLSKVWILVEVPEAQAAWVAEGRPAEARLKALPGKVIEGRVDYVYPMLDAQTRTLRARLTFDNVDGSLKPGMYADVTIFGGERANVTLVPSEAVIRTGTRNVVLVAEGEGRYRPVEVTLGAERAGEMIVLGGLQSGQQVVVSGQFLIDSEASLLGAYRRLEQRDSTDDSPAGRTRLMGAEGDPSPDHRHAAETEGDRP